MCNKYNGWTNYQTWVTYGWLSSNEHDFNFWSEYGERVDSVHELANALKDELEERSPVRSGLYGDLLTFAIQGIDYTELAQAFMPE